MTSDNANTPQADDETPEEHVVNPATDNTKTRRGMWSAGTGDTSGYSHIQRKLAFPEPSERPYGSYFDEVADRVLARTDAITEQNIVVEYDVMTFVIDKTQVLDLAQLLRDDPDLRFEVCLSNVGLSFPEEHGAELHSVWSLLSFTYNRRVSLHVSCSLDDPHMPSLTPVYPMADFHERETWDMFGIVFDGHPALTRILMPDDWQGHPQRKDYPLEGIPVEFKGALVSPVNERRRYF